MRGGGGQEREAPPLGASKGPWSLPPLHAPLTRPASPRRRLSVTPGIAPLAFAMANVTNSNLGGLCGLTCAGKLAADSSTTRYDRTTGQCTYEAAGASDIAAAPPCAPPQRDMYYAGVSYTQAGVQLDMRVTNTTGYLPQKHSANGLSGVWGAIQVLSNTQTDMLIEFVDNVRAPHACPHAPMSMWPTGSRGEPHSLPNQPSLSRRAPVLCCRSPRPRSCWTSSASRSSTSIRGKMATRR